MGNDFFAGAKKRPAPNSSPGPEPESVPAETASAAAEEGSEPWGVTEITLPSQIGVYFQQGPKRLYRVRQLLQPDVEATDWVEVPSMSTVAKILDKPGLVSWAEKSGIALVQELLRNEWVTEEDVKKFLADDPPDPRKPWWGGRHLLEIGTTKKKRTFHRKDDASDRGNSVHQALEAWAMSGSLVDPDVYPESEQGYVLGLNRFLSESAIEPLKSEVIVASVLHRVAGRYDLLGKIPNPVNLVYHLTPKNEKRKVFAASGDNGDILDLKTSAGVYEDHHLQVAGYKGVMIESGYNEPERGFVLRVTQDGRYELVDLAAEWLDFWWLRGLYDALLGVKERGHQNYRKELT